MAYLYLGIAAILEVGWAVGLKYTDGFTRLAPSVATLAAISASLYLLSLATRDLPIGTAYAVWTGLGAVGTLAFGIAFLGEPANLGRLVSAAAILAGVVGLKLTA